jgi:hypothetical protein
MGTNDDGSLGQPPRDRRPDLRYTVSFPTHIRINPAKHSRNDNTHKTTSSIAVLDQRLLAWRNALDPSLAYEANAASSVSILHMQYCSAQILLHRPSSSFGTSISLSTPSSLSSRRKCGHFATQLATIVQDYRLQHGSASYMLSTALYNITMAAIVLIADMADHTSVSSVASEGNHFTSIDECILALRELEETYIVARTVLKQLKYLMKRCRLLSLYEDMEACRTLENTSVFQTFAMPEMDSPPQDLSGGILPPVEMEGMGEGLGAGAAFLMAMRDCDALHTIGTWDLKTGLDVSMQNGMFDKMDHTSMALSSRS